MKIGTVCFSSRQGIGWLPKWFFDEGIITDVMVMSHGKRKDHYQEWYPEDHCTVISYNDLQMRTLAVKNFVDKMDRFFFIETPFDWPFLNYLRSAGKKSFIMPMYECTPVNRAAEPDVWLCPSLLDEQYFPGSPIISVPVPRGVVWQQRKVALRFLHNGGNLGLRGHKGTREILKAMQFVKSPIQMTITSQDHQGLKQIIEECGNPQDPRIKYVYHTDDDKDWKTLYDDADVFIMAEKYNGLSLPLIEARAAGMLVITSNRFPMNMWLPSEPLIPVAGYSLQCINRNYNIYQEALVRPEDIAATIDRVYGRSIETYSIDGARWAKEYSWDMLGPKWKDALYS